MTNVIPLNDLRPHEEGSGCWCRPRLNADSVLVHNAIDGRDILEMAVEAVSPENSLAFFSRYAEWIWAVIEGGEVTDSWRRERTRQAFCRLMAYWEKKGWSASPPEFVTSEN